MRLDVKRKLSVRSDRVKCVDIHPNEPWILVTLFNGQAHIYNHETQVNFIFCIFIEKIIIFFYVFHSN